MIAAAILGVAILGFRQVGKLARTAAARQRPYDPAGAGASSALAGYTSALCLHEFRLRIYFHMPGNVLLAFSVDGK
jgi:membrane associated rhomboid family serine protease